jgi:radical SAM superfamily enzyme YgiQ (UPF0313 family)
MKIVLVEPPNFQRSGKWEQQKVFRTPTNLAILAAYVRPHGHEVSIIDFDIHGGTPAELAAKILDSKPDLVGFTCLTPRYPAALKIAAECKKASPRTTVVFGGPHVSGDPKRALDEACVDYAVAGEGEEPFLELLNALQAGKSPDAILNLIYRAGGRTVVNPLRPLMKDLGALPLPAWDLLELDAYRDPSTFKGAHAGLILGRGCPFDCIFCASKVIWGRKTRLRPPADIIAEIELLVNKFGISEFMFYDDTFTIDKRRATEICETLIKKGLKIRFYVQSRADTLDAELAATLKRAGCFAVAIGVESGDEKILKLIRKGETKDQIRKAVRILKDAGLPCVTSYIVGLPGDTHESIKATLDFANELDSEVAKFMISTPYPGTRLHEMAVERGLLTGHDPDDYCDYTYYQRVAANLSEVSDEDLMKYQQKAYDDYDKRKRPLL